MPIILLTIANSDGVHVITKYFKEIRFLKEPKKALVKTMETLHLPIFLTSITTIGAFSTMAFSPLEPLVGYGICISLGIVWAWVLSSVTLPALIILQKWDVESKGLRTVSPFEALIDRLSNTVLKYPKNKESGEPDYDRNPTMTVKMNYWDGKFNLELFDMKGITREKSLLDNDCSRCW